MAMNLIFGHPDNLIKGKSLRLGIAVGENMKPYLLDLIRV